MVFSNVSRFPNGIESGGVPYPGGDMGISVPNKNGKVWYVDENISPTGGDGSRDAPYSTIQAAINAAGNGTGDTIFVAPGSYTENLTLNKDYLSLVGMYVGGYARPDVTPASGVPITITGQGCTVKHIRFAGTGADSAVQQGNGFIFEDCVFDGDLTATKAGLRLIPHATDTHKTASEGVVRGCLFRGSANGIIFDTGAVSGSGTGSTDNVIEGNLFRSNTLDIVSAKSGAGGAYSVQGVTIFGNGFQDKNKATYIDLTTNADGAAGSQSGSVAFNRFATDVMNTTKIKAVGTAFTFVGNMDTVSVFDGSGLD